MMNDCWPAASGWALIDYYNLPKNAYYAFKRCARHMLASIDLDGDLYRLYVVNDGEAKRVKAEIKILSRDRRSVKEYATLDCLANGASSTAVFEAKDLLDDKEALIVDVKSDCGSDRAFYIRGALEMRPAEVDCIFDKERGTIRVSAKEKYVHAVVLSGEVIFDDNCFSLLPFESRTVSFRRRTPDVDASLSVEAYTLA